MKPVDWVTDEEFLDSELKNLRSVTLYLLSTGRNAWHGTWSEKYQKNAALFSSFNAARKAAEDSRNRGTTFKIQQYPSLAFFSLKGVVALVEFHSEQPFSKLRIEDIGDRLKIGIPIREAILPFVKAHWEFWNIPFPPKDSFVNVKSDLAEDFEYLPEEPYLKKWGSVASGSNYLLTWHQKNKPEETFITQILAEFADQNTVLKIAKCKKELENARQIAIEQLNMENVRIQLAESLSETIQSYLEDRERSTTKEIEE